MTEHFIDIKYLAMCICSTLCSYHFLFATINVKRLSETVLSPISVVLAVADVHKSQIVVRIFCSRCAYPRKILCTLYGISLWKIANQIACGNVSNDNRNGRTKVLRISQILYRNVFSHLEYFLRLRVRAPFAHFALPVCDSHENSLDCYSGHRNECNKWLAAAWN